MASVPAGVTHALARGPHKFPCHYLPKPFSMLAPIQLTPVKHPAITDCHKPSEYLHRESQGCLKASEAVGRLDGSSCSSCVRKSKNSSQSVLILCRNEVFFGTSKCNFLPRFG